MRKQTNKHIYEQAETWYVPRPSVCLPTVTSSMLQAFFSPLSKFFSGVHLRQL